MRMGGEMVWVGVHRSTTAEQTEQVKWWFDRQSSWDMYAWTVIGYMKSLVFFCSNAETGW